MVRVVDTDVARPELTAAIDEALLRSRVAGGCDDTIHLYRRNPPSVSIGYFQSAAEVADLGACRRDGVPVVRRSSGGGAVYTDDRQLVYALVWAPARPVTAKEGFDLACGAIARALGRLGAKGVERAGVNDVLIWGRKVSGSAQAVRKGVHLLHGTVLVDADLDAMFTYLRPLGAKLEAQGLRAPAARVTTLGSVLGHVPPMEEVKRILVGELCSAVGGTPEPGAITASEREEAAALMADKFGRDEWNLRR